MKPELDDDTRPVKVPVRLEGVRTCRPALTRITAPSMGETYPVPLGRRSGIVIGRAQGAGVRVHDPAASREHARVWTKPDGTVLVTDLGSMNGTLVNGQRVTEAVLSEGDKIQVGQGTVLRFSLNDRMDEDWLDHLYQTSIRDNLTGLLNRRYLVEVLERDIALARRHGLPIALILIDADHFKAINDTFGHRGGDDALKDLARLLLAMQRKESLLARYGGEEFAVLLRHVPPAGVEVFAERMRLAVEHHRFELDQASVRMTVSLGVAVTTADGVDSPEDLIEKADRYLYLSKTRGRNCVTTARTFHA